MVPQKLTLKDMLPEFATLFELELLPVENEI